MVTRYTDGSFGINSSININSRIYKNVENGSIDYRTYTTKSGDRLDRIAYDQYKDAKLWWIIAAASGIGWWMQVAEGIELRIPLNVEDIENLRRV